MKQWMQKTLILALAATFSVSGMVACKKKAKPEPRKVEKRTDTPAKGKTDDRTPARTVAKADAKVKDVVCGMTINAKDVKHTHTHDGKTYHFCNAGCLKAFKANPKKYIAKAEPKKKEPAAKQ